MQRLCVLDNLSVTGLDFHTVPDSVAPHSHRHPHRVPHPSRWSIELLWVAFSPLALECLSLPSGGFRLEPSVAEVIVVLEVNRVSIFFFLSLLSLFT